MPFDIDVVAHDSNADEANDTFADATTIYGGEAHLSYVQSQGDLDIFEVKAGTRDEPGDGRCPTARRSSSPCATCPPTTTWR